jgi:catechol 1,2-dioxygenase
VRDNSIFVSRFRREAWVMRSPLFDPSRSRRQFLAWLSATPLVAGCGGGANDTAGSSARAPSPGEGGDPSEPRDPRDPPDPIDGGEGACRATTRDAEGPFYVAGAPDRTLLAGLDEPGVRLVVEGRLLGPDCRTPLAGYVLDVWQADESGAYHAAGAGGHRLRGRVVADAEGRYRFETILPGRYGDAAGIRPAHLHAKVLTPMGNALLTTQIYFAGDPYLGDADYCTRSGTCNSSDAARILALTDATVSDQPGKRGTFDAILART